MNTEEHDNWARVTLRYLVGHVLAYLGGEKSLTYGALANGIGYPGPHTGNLFGSNIGMTLGALGHLIDTLDINGQSAPMIQALVVSANKRLPSDGLKEFEPQYPRFSDEKKRDFVSRELARIFAFGSRWSDVLKELKIERPDNLNSTELRWRRGRYNPYGSEGSPEHRALRDYIAANPLKIGISMDVKGITEYPLKSGDSIDVVFEDDNSVFAVEVKSERSGNDDIERGLYQCIKYAEVLKAEDKVGMRGKEIVCVLVLADSLPFKLRKIRNILGIAVHQNIERS